MTYRCNTCFGECGECGGLSAKALSKRLKQANRFIAIVRVVVTNHGDRPWAQVISKALDHFDKEVA